MKLITGILLIIILTAVGYFLIPKKAEAPEKISETVQPQNTEQTATFTIITNQITRSFTAEKYHNKSEDVFINADNPSVVYVKKEGIKWSDFFSTLPMKLSHSCLVTGDGESLCDGKQGILKFYLNGKEDKNLLDKEINQNDKALIQFTSY